MNPWYKLYAPQLSFDIHPSTVVQTASVTNTQTGVALFGGRVSNSALNVISQVNTR
jgi:hypothetical protein